MNSHIEESNSKLRRLLPLLLTLLLLRQEAGSVPEGAPQSPPGAGEGRCESLLTSLTCPANEQLKHVSYSLYNVSSRLDELLVVLDQQFARNETLPMDQLEGDSQSGSGVLLLQGMQELQTDLMSIRNTINVTDNVLSAEKKKKAGSLAGKGKAAGDTDVPDKAEAVQVALVCLWLELQGLSRNLTQVNLQTSQDKLTTEVVLSDISSQINALQMLIATMNVSQRHAVDRIAKLEKTLAPFDSDQVTSKEPIPTDLHNLWDSNYHINSSAEIGQRLDELRLVLRKSSFTKDLNSQSIKHFNEIDHSLGHGSNNDVIEEVIDIIEIINSHLHNISAHTAKEQTMMKSETQKSTHGHPSHINETKPTQNGSISSFSKITAEACNGFRRHLVGKSCYYVPLVRDRETTGSSNTWWDSRYICKQELGERADLVAIETAAKMQNITWLIDNHFGEIEEFWIGGNDLDTEGDWRWAITSEPVKYSNWGRSPIHTMGQNCMSMLRGLKWAPEPCFFRRHPLCEVRVK